MEPAHIRVADVAPPYCSACFQQKPQQRHVDFGASWDGPVLEALAGAVGVIGQSIDELIVCEDCVKDAARKIGLVDAGQLEPLAQLELANAQLHQRVEQLEAHVGALEAAGVTRDAITGPPITALMPRAARAKPSRGPRGKGKPAARKPRKQKAGA